LLNILQLIDIRKLTNVFRFVTDKKILLMDNEVKILFRFFSDVAGTGNYRNYVGNYR
jgi:hypothetical protein